MENVYKFVKWDVPPLKSLSSSKAYLLMDKLNNGGKLTRDEKNWIVENTIQYGGSYRPLGWEFSFSRYMRRFVVQFYNDYRPYNDWSCYRAFDKTSLRKALSGVKDIHEIK